MSQPIRTVQYSFSYGEISSQLEFRGDVEGYIQAAQRIENFIVDYRGGLFFRPGTLYVGPLRTLPVNLFEFRLFGASDQSFLLVFSDRTVEFVIDRAFQLGATVASSGGSGDYTLLPSTTDIQVNDVWYYGGRPLRVVDVVSGPTDVQVKFTNLDGVVVTIPAGDTVQSRYVIRTPWAADQVRELQLIRHKNEAIIFHPSTHPKLLKFNQDGTWTLEDVNFSQFRRFVSITNLTAIDTLTGAGAPDFEHSAWYVYRVAAVDAYGNESPAGPPVALRRTAMSQVAGRTIKVEWNPVPGAVEYIIYRTREIAAVNPSTGSSDIPQFGLEYGFIGRTSATHFIDENTTPDFVKVPRSPGNPVARRTIDTIFVSAAGSGYIGTGDLVRAPEISAEDDNGNFQLIGYGVVNEAGGIVSVEVIDLPEFLKDPPNVIVSFSEAAGTGATFDVTLTPDSGTFPRTGLFYNQRLLFAGADADPQTVNGSVVGEPFSFDSSTPPLDSDAFSHRIVMGGYDPIVSMKEMSGSVIIGTPVGLWSMSGAGPQGVLSPSSVDVSSQTFTGVGNLGMLNIESGLCFMSTHNRAMYSLSYNPISSAFSVEELTLFASHILTDSTATSWSFNQRPFSNILVTREDGQIASFTYFPSQKIFAWTRLMTDGRFEAVGSIQISTRTETYVATKRFGQPFLEVFAATSDNIEAHHRLDCGYIRRGTIVNEPVSWDGNFITTSAALNVGDVISIPDGGAAEIIDTATGEVHWFYSPSMTSGRAEWFELLAPTATLTGLDLYAGKEVSAVLDGEVATLTIEPDGSVVLPKTARMVSVGLLYHGEVQTLPIDFVEQVVRASFRRHIRVFVRLADRSATKGFYVGPSRSDLTQLHFTEDGLISEVVPFDWKRTGSINLRYDGGLRTTVLGFVIDVVFGS